MTFLSHKFFRSLYFAMEIGSLIVYKFLTVGDWGGMFKVICSLRSVALFILNVKTFDFDCIVTEKKFLISILAPESYFFKFFGNMTCSAQFLKSVYSNTFTS
uniref:Uncharacterized protein n=1 Tax=Cacopsylla melanoneura TaxID=428564 RepID=A0A8D8WWV3_9HEMI